MKTIIQTIKTSNISPKLIRSVIRQIGGKESLPDVLRGGADAGFCGFTYYSDTVAFFKRNRQDICNLAESMAQELGENPVDMVAGFQCLAGRDISARRAGHGTWIPDSQKEQERRQALSEYLPSVSRCLYGGRLTDEDTQAANALAWFALEEVAQAMCDE